jgi:hypothetical protein
MTEESKTVHLKNVWTVSDVTEMNSIRILPFPMVDIVGVVIRKLISVPVDRSLLDYLIKKREENKSTNYTTEISTSDSVITF